MLRSVFVLLVALTLINTTIAATNKVVCYFGSWAYWRKGDGKFLPEDIDTNLCTHVIYSFLDINDDGSVKLADPYLDIDLGTLKTFTGLKQKNSNLKTLIAIGGASGAYKYSNAAADSKKRATWIKSALDLILTYGFDGFDLDWEYPEGGNDVNNFVTLTKEFRAAFDPHKLLLTAAVGAAPFRVDLSYDVPAISKNLDAIHVMTYDLHGAWDDPKATGQNAPLYASPLDVTEIQRQLNVDACIKYWIEKGADPQKLILGLGTYGRSFTLSNSKQNQLGASFSSGGTAGTYTEQSGILGYNEICELQKQGGWTVVWDDLQKVPYALKGNQWIGYDNPRSIGIKVEYAKSLNLGGVMIWSIETDDFKGICGEKYPILKAIQAGLAGSSNENNPVPEPGEDPIVPEPTAPAEVKTTAPAEVKTTAPAEVKTTAPAKVKTTTKQPTNPTTKKASPSVVDPSNPCTKAGYAKDPLDCASYYYCLESNDVLIPIKMPSCTNGLVFNLETVSCDYAQNVQC